MGQRYCPFDTFECISDGTWLTWLLVWDVAVGLGHAVQELGGVAAVAQVVELGGVIGRGGRRLAVGVPALLQEVAVRPGILDGDGCKNN